MEKGKTKRKNCHLCGLESLDDCEKTQTHIPSDENLAPCKFCERNSKAGKIASDFWDKAWLIFADGKRGFDDIEKTQEVLLELLERALEFD
jgi:hypothetical protein